MADFVKHGEIIENVQIALNTLNDYLKTAIKLGYSIDAGRGYGSDKPPLLLTLNAPVIKDSETTDIGRNA